MALSFTTTEANGVQVSYWCVSTLTIRLFKKTAEIGVSGWVSREAYDEGRDPVAGHLFRIGPEEYDQVFPVEQAAPVVGSLYAYLLGLPEWSQAEVVE